MNGWSVRAAPHLTPRIIMLRFAHLFRARLFRIRVSTFEANTLPRAGTQRAAKYARSFSPGVSFLRMILARDNELLLRKRTKRGAASRRLRSLRRVSRVPPTPSVHRRSPLSAQAGPPVSGILPAGIGLARPTTGSYVPVQRLDLRRIVHAEAAGDLSRLHGGHKVGGVAVVRASLTHLLVQGLQHALDDPGRGLVLRGHGRVREPIWGIYPRRWLHQDAKQLLLHVLNLGQAVHDLRHLQLGVLRGRSGRGREKAVSDRCVAAKKGTESVPSEALRDAQAAEQVPATCATAGGQPPSRTLEKTAQTETKTKKSRAA